LVTQNQGTFVLGKDWSGREPHSESKHSAAGRKQRKKRGHEQNDLVRWGGLQGVRSEAPVHKNARRTGRGLRCRALVTDA